MLGPKELREIAKNANRERELRDKLTEEEFEAAYKCFLDEALKTSQKGYCQINMVDFSLGPAKKIFKNVFQKSTEFAARLSKMGYREMGTFILWDR